jgi:D-sedoheptulose 7-phosphate isomerase
MSVKPSTLKAVDDLIERYPALVVCKEDMTAAVEAVCESYRAGHKLIACGNGGSASDAEHVVGELMKGFLLPRKLDKQMEQRFREVCPDSAAYFMENLQGALPALSMVNQVALNTAFANDQAPDLSFAQQLLGMGDEGDVLLAISTSGNSTNVIYALDMARAKGVKSIALTGRSGGKIKAKNMADITICVPEDETFKIQEYHLPVYHMLCIAAENEFFGE